MFQAEIKIHNYKFFLYADSEYLRQISFAPAAAYADAIRQDNAVLRLAKTQLQLYFNGQLTEFTVPFRMSGTDFQKKVWKQLQTIPYGCCRTYKEIAELCGSPKASRAVGSACNANPLPIIVPCHRVIGSSGKLTGYAGGLELKSLLLALEQHTKKVP